MYFRRKYTAEPKTARNLGREILGEEGPEEETMEVN